jgi:hypothetical protein
MTIHSLILFVCFVFICLCFSSKVLSLQDESTPVPARVLPKSSVLTSALLGHLRGKEDTWCQEWVYNATMIQVITNDGKSDEKSESDA